ncbi:MAG: hypothetical protein A4E28_00813 [Methanocella sp. PtaU1.Bin125]|nr:MAG: hypothetical protein A4E28_00813 [Methanocella sp. PtaU1.Bin125]
MTGMPMAKKTVFVILLAMLALIAVSGTAAAQEQYRWQIDYQHITLDVGADGNVYMTYNVSATIVKGVWDEVWIPATVSSMQVHSVTDGSGAGHSFYVDGGQIKTQGWNLRPGDPVSLSIQSTLPRLVYIADRPGYVIVSFIPPWWDMTIDDTMVKYLLPAEINVSEVFTGQREYSGIGTEYNRTMVFFNGSSLAPNQQFDTAVSFPDRYMNEGAVTSKGDNGGVIVGPVGTGVIDSICGSFGCCFPLIFIGFIALVIISSFFRNPYASPSVSMGGMGVNQNLDPVEAAMLLRVDPRRVLTMIMFGLLKKGNAKLLSTDPLRLELVSRKDLNYYEARFADAIKGDKLSEDRLLDCFKILAQRVVDKTRPYSRKETEAFYRQKIDEMWKDVQAVDTPELKLQKYDTDMFWLMADEQFTTKTQDSLRSPGWNTVVIPPYYWWYPYYFGLPHQQAPQTPTTGQPAPQVPSGTAPMPTNRTTSTVENFASKISNSVETTSAGIIGGVESFLGVRNQANAPPPAAPARGGGQGGSSCACVSCACACVSCACACACAGGGGGCT